MEKSNAKVFRPDAFGHCGTLSAAAVESYSDMLLKHTPFCINLPSFEEGRRFIHIVEWGEFNVYIQAHNLPEVESALKVGESFDHGVLRLFGVDHGYREVYMLALVYHYAAHQRFRKLMTSTSSIQNDDPAANQTPKRRAHLLLPLFLAECQSRRVGGEMHENFSRNLIFSILKENPEEISAWY